MNESLFKNEDYLLKEETLEWIMENMDFAENSEYHRGYKSRDYLEPSEEAYATLEVTGTISKDKFYEKFGEVSFDELVYIADDLRENETFKDFLKDTMNDAKHWAITSFSVDMTIETKFSGITVKGVGEDIEVEINSCEY